MTPRTDPPVDRWLRLRDVAQRLGVTRATVRRYIRNGALRAERLPSGHRRIRESALKECLGEK